MNKSPQGTIPILDLGWGLARSTAAPWWGVVWLAVLPWRALEIHFWNRVLSLGDSAGSYGDYLGSIAGLLILAIFPASWGRLVYARVCLDRAEGRMPAVREALRVPFGTLISYVALKLLILAAMILTSLSGVGLLAFVAIGGLATVTAWSVERPGLREGFRRLSGVGNLTPIIGITFVFGIAFVALIINLAAGVSLVYWLADAIPGLDIIEVQALLSSRLFIISLVATALLLLEPFWLATVTALVQIGRHRLTGSDLAARLERVFQSSRIAAILLVLLLSPAAAAAELPRADYLEGLESIARDIRAGRPDSAAVRARSLMDDNVSERDHSFSPDRSLLEPISNGLTDAGELRVVLPRLDATIEALRESTTRAPQSAQPSILEAARANQHIEELRRGGEVNELTIERGIWDDLIDWVTRAYEWISEKLEWLWDLLVALWPRGDVRKETEGGVGGLVLLTTLLIVVCLLALAYTVLRRSRARVAAAPVVTERIASISDEDPRSRVEQEWVSLAHSLAASHRYREAIRAWYNAILSTMIRTRRVQWSRGRTNWEYVAALRASELWKNDFIGLTQDFDREWYGSHEVDTASYDIFARTAASILGSLAASDRRAS